MRLMCSCPLISGFRHTHEGTEYKGTYLTPDVMLKWLAYTYKRKQKCSVRLHEIFAEFRYRDSIAMLFCLNLPCSRKRLQSYIFL